VFQWTPTLKLIHVLRTIPTLANLAVGPTSDWEGQGTLVKVLDLLSNEADLCPHLSSILWRQPYARQAVNLFAEYHEPFCAMRESHRGRGLTSLRVFVDGRFTGPAYPEVQCVHALKRDGFDARVLELASFLEATKPP
jgi:hypothetical protein